MRLAKQDSVKEREQSSHFDTASFAVNAVLTVDH
jgi:hypothetical protein